MWNCRACSYSSSMKSELMLALFIGPVYTDIDYVFHHRLSATLVLKIVSMLARFFSKTGAEVMCYSPVDKQSPIRNLSAVHRKDSYCLVWWRVAQRINACFFGVGCTFPRKSLGFLKWSCQIKLYKKGRQFLVTKLTLRWLFLLPQALIWRLHLWGLVFTALRWIIG